MWLQRYRVTGSFRDTLPAFVHFVLLFSPLSKHDTSDSSNKFKFLITYNGKNWYHEILWFLKNMFRDQKNLTCYLRFPKVTSDRKCSSFPQEAFHFYIDHRRWSIWKFTWREYDMGLYLLWLIRVSKVTHVHVNQLKSPQVLHTLLFSDKTITFMPCNKKLKKKLILVKTIRKLIE